MSEPYTWTPTNSADVIAFANHVRTLADNNATLTLTDDPTIPTMKYNGTDISAWKYNGVEISAAKYNGVVLQ